MRAGCGSHRVIMRMVNQKQPLDEPNPKSIINQVSSLFPNADMRSEYKSFKPKIDVTLTAILKGLASSTADEIGSGVRAIRLGNNAKFLGKRFPGGDTIYERSFYPHLVSTMRGAHPCILLISNPGTGKSVFQFYLLARYLNPSLFKDNKVPQPEQIMFGPKLDEAPKVVIRHLPSQHMEVWFLEQQVVHVIKNVYADIGLLMCFDPETTMYFFEPGKTTNIEPFVNENMLDIPTLATVSPDTSRYKETSKISDILYMPVFTENELLAIGRDMRTRPVFDGRLKDLYFDDNIRSRFATFNGIIRHVLPISSSELKESLVNQKAATGTIDAMKFLTGTIED